jgi:hypothetical protein
MIPGFSCLCSVSQVDQELLFELILAANYMDIKPLLDLSCAKVASMIKVSLRIIRLPAGAEPHEVLIGCCVRLVLACFRARTLSKSEKL